MLPFQQFIPFSCCIRLATVFNIVDLLNARVRAKLTLGVSVSMAMIVCLYLLRAFRLDVKIRYGE